MSIVFEVVCGLIAPTLHPAEVTRPSGRPWTSVSGEFAPVRAEAWS